MNKDKDELNESSSKPVKNSNDKNTLNDIQLDIIPQEGNDDRYFKVNDLIHYKKMIDLESKTRISLSNQISIPNIKIGKLLGEGSFGKVYEGFDELNGKVIAVKEFHLPDISSNLVNERLESFKAESDMLSLFNHPNVVKFYGTNKTQNTFSIYLEFIIGGSIAKMLSTYQAFPESIIRKYTKEILLGLEYLHMHNVIHRDIKGANILVDSNGCCKLSDFGTSKVIAEDVEFNHQNSLKGTPHWMAPETIKHSEYTRFSDIWAIGCTVIEMATGNPPFFQHKNPMSALYHIMNAKEPPELPEDINVSAECRDFIKRCMMIEPRDRYNVRKLLQHDFITKKLIKKRQVNKRSDNKLANTHAEKDLNEIRNNSNLKDAGFDSNIKRKVKEDVNYTVDIKINNEIDDNKVQEKYVEESVSNNYYSNDINDNDNQDTNRNAKIAVRQERLQHNKKKNSVTDTKEFNYNNNIINNSTDIRGNSNNYNQTNNELSNNINPSSKNTNSPDNNITSMKRSIARRKIKSNIKDSNNFNDHDNDNTNNNDITNNLSNVHFIDNRNSTSNVHSKFQSQDYNIQEEENNRNSLEKRNKHDKKEDYSNTTVNNHNSNSNNNINHNHLMQRRNHNQMNQTYNVNSNKQITEINNEEEKINNNENVQYKSSSNNKTNKAPVIMRNIKKRSLNMFK